MEISDDQVPLSYLPFWSGVRRSHWLAVMIGAVVTYPLCISSDPSVSNIMMSAENVPVDVSGTVNVVHEPGIFSDGFWDMMLGLFHGMWYGNSV